MSTAIEETEEVPEQTTNKWVYLFEEGDGQNKGLLKDITVADVQWICQRLAKLTDEQWRDAFRAAAYEPSVAERYIVKLKAKIQEGLAVR